MVVGARKGLVMVAGARSDEGQKAFYNPDGKPRDGHRHLQMTTDEMDFDARGTGSVGTCGSTVK